MPWIPYAIVAAASVVGSVIQSKSASKASKAAAESADQATQALLEMYYQGREDLAPWREAGGEALGDLVNMIEKGPGEFVPADQPGYKFGYEEFVEKPTLRLASATGALGGGGTQKALTRYAQDYASTQYDNFLTRWYKSLTPFQSLAGIGQTTAAQGAETGRKTGVGIAESTLAGGAARETGYVNQANIWGNLLSGVGQNALDYAAMKRQPAPREYEQTQGWG